MATRKDFLKTNETSRLIQDGTNLLATFLNDYQFEEGSAEFIDFINVGLPILDDKHHEAWRFICDNPKIFEPIITKLGGITERGLDLDETVFRRLSYVWIKYIEDEEKV
jgi:hypothetical protein